MDVRDHGDRGQADDQRQRSCVLRFGTGDQDDLAPRRGERRDHAVVASTSCVLVRSSTGRRPARRRRSRRRRQGCRARSPSAVRVPRARPGHVWCQARSRVRSGRARGRCPSRPSPTLAARAAAGRPPRRPLGGRGRPRTGDAPRCVPARAVPDAHRVAARLVLPGMAGRPLGPSRPRARSTRLPRVRDPPRHGLSRSGGRLRQAR